MSYHKKIAIKNEASMQEELQVYQVCSVSLQVDAVWYVSLKDSSKYSILQEEDEEAVSIIRTQSVQEH